MSQWIKVSALEEIPKLGARVVETSEGNIAVFRNNSNEVFALRDHCPHSGGPLSQGIVHGKSVTCPLHNWVIQMNNGEAVAPDVGCAQTYVIKLEDNIIYLLLT